MGISALKALAAAAVLLPLVLPPAAAWSNGGFSADPSNPDYGTHDWLAERAFRWLPSNESGYIRDDLAAYLYGTELPDRSNGTGAIGDTTRHHVYYRADGTLQDNASARRAQEEYGKARACLEAGNLSGAAERAGVMSHYIVDVGVFGHVMGAATDWGAEKHHSDYEAKVESATDSNVSGIFGAFLVFDGALGPIDACNATLAIAFNTTFGDGADGRNCTWMDSHYNWSDPAFVNSTGASMNRCVNLLADVLHTLAIVSGYSPADTIPPSVAISWPASGATLSSTLVNVSGTASDDVAVDRVEISQDRASWTRCDGNVSWSGTLNLSEGPNTIYARAFDISGNANTTNTSVNVSLPDLTPPSVAIVWPENGSHLTSAVVTVRGTATDDRRLSLVELGADGATWVSADFVANGTANDASNGTSNETAGGPVNWSANLTLSPGLNTVRARATDAAGNHNETEVTVFLDDVVAPFVRIDSPSEGAEFPAGNVEVFGIASDGGGICAVDIGTDNATWVGCVLNASDGASATIVSWSGSLNLQAGPGTIYARATDNAGNAGFASADVTAWTSDVSAPVVTIIYPVEGTVLSSVQVAVAGTASDDTGILGVEASVGNQAWVRCDGTAAWSVNLTLSGGASTILVRAGDLWGNIGVASVNVTVALPDVLPPIIRITGPLDGEVLGSANVTVSGSAHDDWGLSRVDVSDDNATWWPCAGTESWTGTLRLADGPNTIFACAVDASGNAGYAKVRVTVIVPDTMPPSVSVLGPENGSVVKSADLALKVHAEDPGGVRKVEVSLDGISWTAASGNGTWFANITLKEGKNTIRIRAVDASGNVGNATVTVTFKRGARPGLIPGMEAGATLAALLALIHVAGGRCPGRRRTAP